MCVCTVYSSIQQCQQCILCGLNLRCLSLPISYLPELMFCNPVDHFIDHLHLCRCWSRHISMTIVMSVKLSLHGRKIITNLTDVKRLQLATKTKGTQHNIAKYHAR